MAQQAKQGPLSGIIVVSLEQILSVPYATRLMADFGATIIKIESKEKGDAAREFPPIVDGESAYFAALNYGKKSIALDLTNVHDRAVFEKLLLKADVLTDNFVPGVMTQLGYDWDFLHKKYPKLIYGTLTFFGQTGINPTKPGSDLTVQASSGIISITGPDENTPVRCGAEVAEITGAVYLAIGVIAALIHRSHSQEGCMVDVSKLSTLFTLMHTSIIRYYYDGENPAPFGNRERAVAPHDVYPTKDKLLSIEAANNHLFIELCKALGCEELITDNRFATNLQRTENQDKMSLLLAEKTRLFTAAELSEKLEKAGVPFSPISQISDLMTNPQLKERNMLVKFTDGYMPEITFAGNPIKLSSLPQTTVRPLPPKLDQHREEILKWIDGL